MLTLFGCSRLRYSSWVRASLRLQSPERGVLPLRRSPGESKASWLPREKTYTAGQEKDLDGEAHHVLQSSFSAWSCVNDFFGSQVYDVWTFFAFTIFLWLSWIYDFPWFSGFPFLAGNTLFTRRTSNEHHDCIFLSVCLLQILHIYPE
jgi:hypothetical protein